MKSHISLLSLLFFLFLLPGTSLPAAAASEAEYGKVSRSWTLRADGSQEYRFSMELTLFTHTAMNRTYGESFIVYNPRYQELVIHRSCTRQKDGTLVQTPENAFVEVLPRQAADAPAFNHLKEMVVVHTGLELGATVYLDYSLVSKPGYLPALDICEPLRYTSPVKEYTLTLSVPEGTPLRYALSGVKSLPETGTAGGMTQVTWRLRNVPASSREPLTTGWDGDAPCFTATSYASLQAAMKELKERMTFSAETVSALWERLSANARTDADKIAAAWRYVSDQLATSGVSLAETGYTLRSAEEIIASAYATREEKTALFGALLRAGGLVSETVAAWHPGTDPEAAGLSAVQELFVYTEAAGKPCYVVPGQKGMAPSVWYAGFARFTGVTDPGKAVEIASPDTGLKYRYTITLAGDQAKISRSGQAGEAFVPYFGEVPGPVASATQTLQKTAGRYLLLALPDVPYSIARKSYHTLNTRRQEPLLLPGKVSEQFDYTLELPEGVTLKTPESARIIENGVGRMERSVKQNGNTVEVVRTLTLHKQRISPADYPDFRRLMVEWGDEQGRQLLLESDASVPETTASAYRFDHGPYLQGLTYSEVFVYFTTSQKGFSWVDLRPAGEKEYIRCVTTDDGLIEANNTKNAIRLQKLTPRTSYEYRLVSVPIKQFRLSQNIYGDTIRTPWYTFKTPDPDANTCSFITTSDIHDDAEKYERLLSYMPVDEADVVFLLGDILSHFSRVEQPYTSFIDVSVKCFAKEKPFVLVRGNHDTRGSLARTYPEYIHRPRNHFYGAYQWGNIFIVLLDNGEDKPDSHHDYSGITAFDDYRAEQLEWLKGVTQSDAYKNAEKRIILTHIPPIPRGESTRASVHAGDVLYREYLPVLNAARVDLMIAGHTHRFMLIEPKDNPNYRFPLLVNDNRSASFVRVTPSGISVKTVNDRGEVTFEKVF